MNRKRKIEFIFLFVVIVLAIALRFYKLGLVPVGVTHDELGYIYNSYSIALTGKNVFSEPFPFLTWMVQGGFPFLPVAVYFTVPIYWFFEISLTIARTPYALLGVLDVILVYLLVKKLFSDGKLAILSAFFVAISPWHLHFSRSAYDPNVSLFFYLLAIVLFFVEVQRKKIPFFSVLSFLLAIFSYRGMTVLFLPLVFFLGWYGKQFLKVSKKQSLGFAGGILIVIFLFFTVIHFFGESYTKEALFFQDPKVQETIDGSIRESQGPLLLRRLFINKPTFYLRTLSENYLKSYSPEFLFLYTEPNQIYSIWTRGRVYLLDLPFLILGVFYFFTKRKKTALFMLGLFLISGLPGMIGGAPYSARNLFMAVVIPVFVAGGVLFLISCVRLRWVRVLTIGLLAVLYAYSLGGYLFDYYYRYAYQSAEAWAKSLQDVSVIAHNEILKQRQVIITNTSFGDVVQFAFYEKYHPASIQNTWKNKKQSEDGYEYTSGLVTFQRECIQLENIPELKKKNITLITAHDCNKEATPSAFIRDYFGNPIWKIYN